MFGIIIAHCVYSFYKSSPQSYVKELGYIDNLLLFVVNLFIERKFFTIFSFIFGLIFAIQNEKGNNKRSFVFKFLWKMLLLLIIGVLHNEIYNFDILQIYAFCGLILVLFSECKTKILPIVSLVFWVLSSIAIFYSEDLIQFFKSIESNGCLIPAKLPFQVFSGRLPMILSLFIFGYFVGRLKLFNDLVNHEHYFIKAMIISFFIKFCFSLGKEFELINVTSLAYEATIVPLQNLTLACIYVSLVVVLSNRIKVFKKLTSWLIPLGKTGLTNYVAQSVYFLFLFEYLFKYLFKLENLYVPLLITLFFFFTQVIISKWWTSCYRLGPVEWLWKSCCEFKFKNNKF